MSVEAGKTNRHRRRMVASTTQQKSEEINDHNSFAEEKFHTKTGGRIFKKNNLSFRQMYHRLSNKDTLPVSVGSKATDKRMLDNWIDLVLLLGVICCGLVSIYCFYPQLFSLRYIRAHVHFGLRPTTDADVDRIEVRIPSLDFDNGNVDIGGWMMFHKIFKPTSDDLNFGMSDFGDELDFQGQFGSARKIDPTDARKVELAWLQEHPDNTTRKIKPYYEYAEAIEDIPFKCRRVNWKHTYYPSCNDIHSVDLTCDYNEERSRIGDTQTLDSFYIR